MKDRRMGISACRRHDSHSHLLMIMRIAVVLSGYHSSCCFAQITDTPGNLLLVEDQSVHRTLLLLRSTMSYSNELLHSYSRDESDNYKAINIDLDKYTRAFDMLDLIFDGLRTVVNAYDTYETVTERLSDFADLLSDYTTNFLAKGNVSTADIKIVEICNTTISLVKDDIEELYTSLYDLILYITGAAGCSTADMMTILNRINDAMDELCEDLNIQYMKAYNYMLMRKGYWKESLYATKTLQEIVDEAQDRWTAIMKSLK